MNIVQKLRALSDSISRGDHAAQVEKEWQLAERLLSRTPADPDVVREAVRGRDAAALDAIVSRLEQPGAASSGSTPPAPATAFSKEDKDAAMRAFKKRLRVMRLSDESRLGGRYTSGGRKSSIDAIEPPADFPREMWQALAAEGRLVDTGQGFFALPG